MKAKPVPNGSSTRSFRFPLLAVPLGAILAIGGPMVAQQPDTSVPAEVIDGIRNNIHSNFRVSFDYETHGEEWDESKESMIVHAIERGAVFRDLRNFRHRFETVFIRERTRLRHEVVDSFTATLDSNLGELEARGYRYLETGNISLSSEVWDNPEFANRFQFPEEVNYSFEDDPDIDSHMPFWTGRLNGIGNVRDIIEGSKVIQHVRCEYQGRECWAVSCNHEGRECRFTFCPGLDWMVVRIEVKLNGNGDQPNSLFEASVTEISDDGTQFCLFRENAKQVANSKIVNYRTVTRYTNVKRGPAGEAGWIAHLVPENSPVMYSENSQIQLVWRNGRLEKDVNDNAIRNLELLPDRLDSGSAKGPHDPVWLTFLFIIFAVPFLYILSRHKQVSAGITGQRSE